MAKHDTTAMKPNTTTPSSKNDLVSAGQPSILVRVQKLSDRPGTPPVDDWVASEAPLEVRLGGQPATVLMRTPKHNKKLIRGFLFSEGIVSSAADIASITHIQASDEQVGGSVIGVELVAPNEAKTLERSFYSNSSCGVCGKQSIASLEVQGPIADTAMKVQRSLLGTLPGRLRDAQTTFAKTGGVHASGLFTADGELLALREDVGRHNALDKIIGWAMAENRLPLSNCVLLLSGRISYELVQKAVVAAIPFIAAVGAPSSLAIEVAERFRLTLVGFLRPDSMNVYCHPERIIEESS